MFYTNSGVVSWTMVFVHITLSRGVGQGRPLSQYLFILAAEVLATKICQEKYLFTNNTSAFCFNLWSVQNLKKINCLTM